MEIAQIDWLSADFRLSFGIVFRYTKYITEQVRIDIELNIL